VPTPLSVLGLDIGGANLKAAHTSGVALSLPFALWRAPHELPHQLAHVIAAMPAHDALAVTMTGELCDCFESKTQGVHAILNGVQHVASGPTYFWSLIGRFVDLPTARDQPLTVASANWLALAHLAAQYNREAPGLMIDIGSTTTDIVYLDDGLPQPRASTDRARLAAGELVYTGLRRTPVCSVLGMEVAAELFATMLDVHIVLGLADERAADTDSADGRPFTRGHCHARLARMQCADANEVTDQEIRTLARHAVQRQLQHLGAAVDRVLRDRPSPRQVVISGSGEGLARQICASHPRLTGCRVVPLLKDDKLSEAAAAYAVAVLAQEQLR
jgi:(4-(4-[2-(gamma-L-glutamylamino)ethyl]phenoxymethyl)furan-2-yl)methanamine synthase